MAFKFKPEAPKPRSNNLDHVSLEIESFDRDNNTFNGVNIETGEQMSIRMASADEMARLYAPRRIETDAERQSWGERQVAKQPTAKEQSRKGDIGGVIQMQNVKELPNGDHIARWNNYVSTSPEDQTAFKAEVEIFHRERKDNDGTTRNWRDVKAVLIDESFPAEDPAAAAKIENLLSNNSQRELPMDFSVRTAAVVVLTVDDDPEKRYGRVFTEFDKESRQPVFGAEHNITRPTTSGYEAIGQTALAAVMDIPFEKLQHSKVDREKFDPEFARAVYDAVQSGDVKVSIAPQIQANVMQHLDDALVREKDQGKGLANRGFFSAHVGMEKGGLKEDSNESYDGSFRQILATSFTPDKTQPSFVQRNIGEITSAIADTADIKRQMLPKPQMEKEQDHEQDQNASFGASMDM
jgi:hypothetical protein